MTFWDGCDVSRSNPFFNGDIDSCLEYFNQGHDYRVFRAKIPIQLQVFSLVLRGGVIDSVSDPWVVLVLFEELLVSLLFGYHRYLIIS